MNIALEKELKKSKDLTKDQIEAILKKNEISERAIYESLMQTAGEALTPEDFTVTTLSTSYTGIPSPIPSISFGLNTFDYANEAKYDY